MPTREHRYRTRVIWTGNTGSGTSDYRAYSRDHDITAGDKPPISGSADKSFRGDPARWNPEDLLLASLSTCHQLWYLHLCADAGVTVTSYEDNAVGIMIEEADGAGRFTSVTLHPTVVLAHGADAELARKIHHDAHAKCFIARSVNFPVTCEPQIAIASP
jgi:organic hydroperoxide reductase OsmC/OhrA